jgi:hypothetical protein
MNTRTMSLNELAEAVHKANIKWWRDIETSEPIQRNKKELLSLVISEISECLEGRRKDLMDDKLTHRKMEEVEMADTYIRLLDYAGGFGITVYDWSMDVEFQIPDNFGEALFNLTRQVASIAESGLIAESEIGGICGSLSMIRAICSKWGYDLDGAVAEKMAYNAKRNDHKHEARKSEGGKKF